MVEVLVIPRNQTMNRNGRRVVYCSEACFLLSPSPLPRQHFVETVTTRRVEGAAFRTPLHPRDSGRCSPQMSAPLHPSELQPFVYPAE